MKEVLVTGSKGLIGSELMKRFPEAVGIDKGDKIPNDRFEVIIHCAANCVIREVIKNPELAKENVDFSFQILEKARRDRSKIILFSSSRVTGEENPYVTSKKFMEDLALAYKNCYNLRYIIIRPETVWSRDEKNRRVINTWIDAVKDNNPIVVYGNEDKELPPIQVTEFVKIFLDIFNKFDEFVYKTLTISGQPRKVTEIINAIGDYYNKTPNIKFEDPEPTQPQKCNGADITGEIPFEEQLKL